MPSASTSSTSSSGPTGSASREHGCRRARPRESTGGTRSAAASPPHSVTTPIAPSAPTLTGSGGSSPTWRSAKACPTRAWHPRCRYGTTPPTWWCAQRVSAHTQNQALSGILFLCREVLGEVEGALNGARSRHRASQRVHLPLRGLSVYPHRSRGIDRTRSQWPHRCRADSWLAAQKRTDCAVAVAHQAAAQLAILHAI